MAYERVGQKKHFWLFMILLALGVIVLPLGLDALGASFANNEIHTFIYESLGTLTVILLCVIVLVVFYIINTVAAYKLRRGWPKDFWSAWGICKKALALIAVIACIVIYIVTLSNVISDVNDEPSYKIITTSDQITSAIDNKISLNYYEEDDVNKENAKYKTNIFMKDGVSVAAGKTYKIRVFERSNFWVAVEEING